MANDKPICGKQMTQWSPGTGAMFCNSAPGHEGSCSYRYFFRDNNPPGPTLTCSEVVERLAKEAHKTTEIRGEGSDGIFNKVPVCHGFDHAKAEAILHSWRERRVQELEEALRKIVDLRLTFTDWKPSEYAHPLMQNLDKATEIALAAFADVEDMVDASELCECGERRGNWKHFAVYGSESHPFKAKSDEWREQTKEGREA